ncbi:SH3 domain-containing protein [Marimonas sp. MJW-29]|uniref:SH3 domain-containing protein n=1 Tax=Sulfitobacter sediminis TaxID=3234186 RepID=A0ABV3RVE2_9RHOB
MFPVVAAVLAVSSVMANAQSRDLMVNECSAVAQNYFRDFNARTDMRYNGQRVDGSHAINGRIFLETDFEDFACSYEREGRSMVEFFAEGQVRNSFLPGYGPAGEGSVVQVTSLRDGDTLNMRSGPGTSNRIIGALSNGTSVRNLGCQMQSNTRWCEIEMMTDMRERGWVAGRYLTIAGSAPPPASGPIVRVTGVAANDVLNVRAGPGTRHRVVGALSNGSQVRRLGCQSQGQARWCQIEMMTDMRERGWVNARFLTGQSGQATQLPSMSRVERVRFASGTTGTEIRDQLGPGSSVTYILGAQNGQNLYFRLAAQSGSLSWRLFNPDGSLLDRGGPSKEYRGQLWQSGEHSIEVMNSGGRQASFNVIFGIR